MSSATTTIVRTEARLFGRELGTLFWVLLFPTLLLGVLGAVPGFREADADLGGQRGVDLYASVSVLLAIIVAAIMSMPVVLTGYRESGVLRRLRTTPVRPGSLLAAQVTLHAAAALASAVLVLGFARVAYDVALPESFLVYVACLVLAAAATFSVGAVITAVARTSRVAQTVGMIVFFPSMFTAGVYVPVQAMSGRLHDIVVLTPLGAAAEALNDTMVGRNPDLADVLVVVAWTVVLSLLAVRWFRWQ